MEDLRVVLSKATTKALYVDRIVHALDSDGDGTISWTEFLAGALCVKFCKTSELVDAAFAHFDVDGTGKISAKDVENGLFNSGGVQHTVLHEGRQKFNQIS